jgi:hypothetical protein
LLELAEDWDEQDPSSPPPILEWRFKEGGGSREMASFGRLGGLEFDDKEDKDARRCCTLSPFAGLAVEEAVSIMTDGRSLSSWTFGLCCNLMRSVVPIENYGQYP